MKILYDYSIFDIQRIGGISRYFYELMNNNENSYSLGVRHSENEYLLSHKSFGIKRNVNLLKYDNFITKHDFKGKSRLFNLYCKIHDIDFEENKKESINQLKEGNFDVFHPTYYDPYFLDFIGDKPFVLTIHDMIQEKYVEFYNSTDNLLKNKKILAEKATKIIAISEYTKKDIIDYYGIPESKISVIYHGSSKLPNSESTMVDDRIKSMCNGKYFLFTGSRGLYKNFYFFIEAISELLINSEFYVICTAGSFSIEEKCLFEHLGISNKVLHCFASDSELSYLYKNALAFVFPSYYEGFGLPILEAFSANCPVILAKSSCFPEIAQDAALYFEPKSKQQLLSCCNTIISDKNCRKNLIRKGNERVSSFSWKKTVEQTMQIYKEALTLPIIH